MASDIGSRMVAFGTNEWLVDEIYQQYLKDPQSVDRAWWDFFADYRPGESTGALPTPSPSAAPPAPGDASIQDSMAGITPVAPPPPADAATAAPQAPAEPRPKAAAAPAAPPAPTGPKVVVPQLGHTVSGSEMEAPASPQDRIAPQPNLASIPTVADERDLPPRVLRGPAARVVVNMEASLQVPTATSVRGLPAKLLIHNRQVINNQLSRGRGGKVSFTHLIGYALVRALADMPEMNVGFTTVEGKPAVVTHQSVNLGLAIDLAKPDGTRQLPVPCIRGAEQMDFASFWATYEETGPQGPHRWAHRGRLRRHDRDPDQPGHDRHGAQRAAADVGPGPDRRGRLVGLSSRVAGCGTRHTGPPGGEQDPDPDLHLRPPDHPGCPVRGVPAQGAPAAPG